MSGLGAAPVLATSRKRNTIKNGSQEIPLNFIEDEVEADGSLGLQGAQLGDRTAENVVGLGAGAVHRFEDFLDPGNIGYIESRDRVAGFLSHRFTQMPGPANEMWRNSIAPAARSIDFAFGFSTTSGASSRRANARSALTSEF